MKKLLLLSSVILFSVIGHAQTLSGTCLGSAPGFVTSAPSSCTIAANELLVTYVEACSSAVSGSACYQPIHADPVLTFSGGGLTWTKLQSISLNASTTGTCNFTISPLCSDAYSVFCTNSGAVTGAQTFTAGSAVATQIEWTVLRFSGMTATSCAQVQSTASNGFAVGGASSYTDGTLTINSNNVTAIIPYSASNLNGNLGVIFLGFNASNGHTLLIIIDAGNFANVGFSTPTGYTLILNQSDVGYNFSYYNNVILTAPNVFRKKGWIF